MNEWYVYVLVAEDGHTYTGVSTDPERRLRQHNGELVGGAKATRAHRPWSIGRVWSGFATRSQAQRAEASVKRLRGTQRLLWENAAKQRLDGNA